MLAVNPRPDFDPRTRARSALTAALLLAAHGCGGDDVATGPSDTGSSSGPVDTTGPGPVDETSGTAPTSGATPPDGTTSTSDASSGGGTSTSGVDPSTTTDVASTGGTTAGAVDDTGTGGSGSSGTDGDTSTGGEESDGTGGDTSTGGEESDGTGGDTEGTGGIVEVQLLAFNDFHGNLEPPAGSSGKIKLKDDSLVDAGGAAYLATHVAALRSANPNTVVVSAGDLIGASPLVSALFHDEPTIEAMNAIGLQYNAVGNHEFDDGALELLRMQQGGCHPKDGCSDGTPFPGASFQFLAANVLVDDAPIKTLLPGHAVHEVGGVKIGFIGMTLEGTPQIVTPSGIAGLQFIDEAMRANDLVPDLLLKGANAIVVLIHEGGYQTGYYDQCEGVSGAIVDIVMNLDPMIDIVVSGHTHQAYNCVIADKLVTSAASFGRLITDIDVQFDQETGEVVGLSAKNRVVTRDVADPDMGAFVTAYKDLAAPLANKPIGTITATLEKTPLMMSPGLSSMGAVIADAQLEATKDPMLGASQIAFMNPGGVRADLVYPASPPEQVDGIVTYGEAFTVQPFGNTLVVMTLTGAQIDTLLEQEFVMGKDPKILQVSEGFEFAYSLGAPIGQKIDPASMKLDGVVIDPNASYRVTVNSFMASGGDGFTVLVDGTDRVGGVTDLDALAAYFADHSPVSPPALDRITLLP